MEEGEGRVEVTGGERKVERRRERERAEQRLRAAKYEGNEWDTFRFATLAQLVFCRPQRIVGKRERA